MRVSTLIAFAVWVFVVGGNVVNTFMFSAPIFKNEPQPPWYVAFLPLVIVVSALWRRSWSSEIILERLIDNIFGQGCYSEFKRTLRLELMFATMCFSITAAALVRFLLFGLLPLPPTVLGFFANGGLAYVASYYIRRWREASQ